MCDGTGNNSCSCHINYNRTEMIKLLRHIEDTLAPQVDEGRDWLRKAPGNCQNSFDPGVSEWENLYRLIPVYPGFMPGGQPAELKHLSKRRKRK